MIYSTEETYQEENIYVRISKGKVYFTLYSTVQYTHLEATFLQEIKLTKSVNISQNKCDFKVTLRVVIDYADTVSADSSVGADVDYA